MRRSSRLLSFALACASGAITARAQSPTISPKPDSQVKKLAVMVGKFTDEGEMKAGAVGPNSPAMKVTGIDDCRWASGGFSVTCTHTEDVGGTKVSEASFIYYDPISKTYQFHGVDSTGQIDHSVGTVSGDTWTWVGESIIEGKVWKSRFVMKFVSKDSYEYTADGGESENTMKVFLTGKETRVATKAASSKPAQ